MRQIYVKSFADLMCGFEKAEIKCLHTGKVVRKLEVPGGLAGGTVRIETTDPTIEVALETPIKYEPWFMDRGSLVFTLNGRLLKIATEADIIEFEGGDSASILPAADCDKVGHRPVVVGLF